MNDPLKAEAWDYDIDDDEGVRDSLEEITQSMTYTSPQLGDNVIKRARLIRICKTRGCAKAVFISLVNARTGRVEYSCPEHGKRNRAQLDWLDVTGSTMLEFRKVGLQ